MITPKKALGQHWLHDESVLTAIADAGEVVATDTIVEVGPGLGTLTAVLASRAQQVIAVELDGELAHGLQTELTRQHVANVRIDQTDILRFDLTTLPADYKIVANIPYYLTSHLLRILTETHNKPQIAVLLMQKEVAERVCAEPGAMSILSVAVQLQYEVRLDVLVPARYFTPPPKVDSQVLVLTRRNEPLVENFTSCMRLVRIGFSAKRKLLTNTLSAGLHIPKQQAAALLSEAGIADTVRAEALSLEAWQSLHRVAIAAGLL